MIRRRRSAVPAATDRGAADALELVILAPVLVVLALLVISFSRQVDGLAQVRTAAEAAAQAAALERDPGRAVETAQSTALSMLTSVDSCSHPTVAVTRSVVGIGLDDGLVEVTVSCVAPNQGIEPVQSTDVALSATAYATVDLFRARSGG
ncbi:MAG: hypothetical protein CSA55_01090 [Ilumatobacter coccineus]|uniref:Pilus assembly protein TadE n=1 Tax=Ilumatobacter coccineus TaxID=467094 RepID=A0A2G6KFE0_9ACTN|nr:MAG: hypothetical protein CSA55_01090 [Ilumatobacter coccineus]